MSESTLTSARTMSFVATANPTAARQFYSEVLGLQFLHDDDFALIFRLSGDTLLRVQKVPGLTPQMFTVFGWQVDDMDATVEELTMRGVTFEKFGFPGQDDRGVCAFPNGDQVAWFKDPDGNTLSLAQIA